MSKQTIIVFGATGNQGGSVINSILADSKASSRFHLKGVTRDPTKESSKALASKGVEVVKADLNDRWSLHNVIKGAYGVFAVTNFWETFSVETEIAQGKNIADVSKEEGVQHLVWSSLLNITKLSRGILPGVYHFDGKAEVEEYIRSLGIPATFFLAGFFMSNLPGGGLRENNGKWSLALPMPGNAPIPLLAAEYDTGKFVKAIFLKKEATLGKQIYGAQALNCPMRCSRALWHQLVLLRLCRKSCCRTCASSRNLDTMAVPRSSVLIQIVDEPLTTWKEYVKLAPAFASLK